MKMILRKRNKEGQGLEEGEKKKKRERNYEIWYHVCGLRGLLQYSNMRIKNNAVEE